jgi:hypothetical protein
MATSAVQVRNRAVFGLAGFWAAFFFIDGALRLFAGELAIMAEAWPRADILSHAARIFAGLNWPLGKVGLIGPIAGAWEIAVAMFLFAGLYEVTTGDSTDILPGSAMLILGLTMALTSLGIVLGAAWFAGHGKTLAEEIWPFAGALGFSLLAGIVERQEAERAMGWPLPASPGVGFRS